MAGIHRNPKRPGSLARHGQKNWPDAPPSQEMTGSGSHAAASPLSPSNQMMSEMSRSKAVLQKSPAATAEQGRAVRLTRELLDQVDAWALSQKQRPNRSEAIQLLVKTALKGLRDRPMREAPDSNRESPRIRAKELASDAIDRLGDANATSEDRASRKGRLMKGPEEFRNVRRDRSNS